MPTLSKRIDNKETFVEALSFSAALAGIWKFSHFEVTS